jgi:hypothetical protein
MPEPIPHVPEPGDEEVKDSIPAESVEDDRLDKAIRALPREEQEALLKRMVKSISDRGDELDKLHEIENMSEEEYVEMLRRGAF